MAKSERDQNLLAEEEEGQEQGGTRRKPRRKPKNEDGGSRKNRGDRRDGDDQPRSYGEPPMSAIALALEKAKEKEGGDVSFPEPEPESEIIVEEAAMTGHDTAPERNLDVQPQEVPSANGVTAEPAPISGTDMIARARARHQEIKRSHEERRAQLETVPQILAYLDNELFPDMDRARQYDDKESVAEFAAIVRELRSANPAVAAELDRRRREKEEVENAELAEKARQKREAHNSALAESMAAFKEWATVASFHEAIALLEEDPTAEPIIPPVLVPWELRFTNRDGSPGREQMRVPTANGGDPQMVPLSVNEAALVRLHRQTVEVLNRDNGQKSMETWTIATVVDETSGLAYRSHTTLREGEPGQFRLITDRLKSWERQFRYPDAQRRGKDLFDALKAGLENLWTKEENAMRGERIHAQVAERMEAEKKAARLSANEFLVRAARGKFHAESRFYAPFREQVRSYKAEVVLERDEGDKITVTAWESPTGPMNTRFNALRGINSAVRMTLEVSSDPSLTLKDGVPTIQNGLPKGSFRVLCHVVEDDLPPEGDRKRAEVIGQAHNLARLLRQVLLNEMYEQYAEGQESDASAEQETETEETGEPVVETSESEADAEDEDVAATETEAETVEDASVTEKENDNSGEEAEVESEADAEETPAPEDTEDNASAEPAEADTDEAQAS